MWADNLAARPGLKSAIFASVRFIGQLQPGKPVRWWHPFGLGLVASLMWAFSFAILGATSSPSIAIPIATLGLISVAVAARNGGALLKVRGRLWLGSMLFGLGHVPALGIAHLYVWKTAAPAYPLLLLYLASFPAMAAFLASRLSDRWPKLPCCATIPFLWVTLEIVRGEWLIGGYPWYLLGHTLTSDKGVAWSAQYIGAYGCSLMLALAACAIIDMSGRIKDQTRAAVAFVCAIGVFAIVCAMLVVARSSPPPVRTFRVAILQTNLPQDNKIGWASNDRVEAHTRWLALTAEATEAGATSSPRRPQLVVWPETMFPGFALNPEALDAQRRAGLTYTLGTGAQAKPLAATWFADSLIETQTRARIPFLVGAIASDGLRYSPTPDGRVKTDVDARTNSAILITDGRVQSERYDKMDLMAFGEYIPVVYRWPGIQNWLTGLGAQGMSFDLAFGKQRTLFNVEGVRIGTPICFEVCHESACRRFTTADDGNRRADLLVNITNDGWFYGSDFNRRMHLLQARWRCAELATPMARAANTGISCIIDSSGKVITPKLDGGAPLTQTEGILTADVPLLAPDAPPTFYATTGHHIKTLVVALGGFLALAAFWPKPERTPESPAA